LPEVTVKIIKVKDTISPVQWRTTLLGRGKKH